MVFYQIKFSELLPGGALQPNYTNRWLISTKLYHQVAYLILMYHSAIYCQFYKLYEKDGDLKQV